MLLGELEGTRYMERNKKPALVEPPTADTMPGRRSASSGMKPSHREAGGVGYGSFYLSKGGAVKLSSFRHPCAIRPGPS